MRSCGKDRIGRRTSGVGPQPLVSPNSVISRRAENFPEAMIREGAVVLRLDDQHKKFAQL
jgi:hypothetical protein